MYEVKINESNNSVCFTLFGPKLDSYANNFKVKRRGVLIWTVSNKLLEVDREASSTLSDSYESYDGIVIWTDIEIKEEVWLGSKKLNLGESPNDKKISKRCTFSSHYPYSYYENCAWTLMSPFFIGRKKFGKSIIVIRDYLKDNLRRIVMRSDMDIILSHIDAEELTALIKEMMVEEIQDEVSYLNT